MINAKKINRAIRISTAGLAVCAAGLGTVLLVKTAGISNAAPTAEPTERPMRVMIVDIPKATPTASLPTIEEIVFTEPVVFTAEVTEEPVTESVQPEAVNIDADRDLIERVVMAESGGESYEGQMAVAQCILDAMELHGISGAEAVKKYQYASPAAEASESVKSAVSAVFDKGARVTDQQILFFYAPRWCESKWHESQRFVIEIGGHRFFALND